MHACESGQKVSLFCACSLRQSVSGEENWGRRSQKAVRHEGVEESQHRPEDEDNRTHKDRAPGAGSDSPVSVPRHPSLRIPDRSQTAPHIG